MSEDTVSVHVGVRTQAESCFDKELVKRYHRLREDYLWIFANEARLRLQYANEYIAVQNKTVRFKDDTMEGIISKIADSSQKVEDFLIEYIGERPVNFLF